MYVTKKHFFTKKIAVQKYLVVQFHELKW